ncbi:hypothetical protein [Streptomyces sp. ALB3]|uniref:hypothetical protein n=1 Tax=Streptomyces sp. ALB3 TaxID=3374278 RepID=UPI0037B0A830
MSLYSSRPDDTGTPTPGVSMSNPQQPEQRRSDKGGGTPQDSAEIKAGQPGRGPGGKRAHGTDKGHKGGGEGGATPPAQQPDHP